MRIASYAELSRTRNPTGVGKHIINMLGELNRVPEVDLTLLVSKYELNGLGQISDSHPLQGLSVYPLPLPARTMGQVWKLSGMPAVDRWCPEADWVYCPVDSYVPTKRVPLAVTMHCVNWFDAELPWFNEPQTRRVRWGRWLSYKPILRDAQLILTVSEFLKSRLVDLFQVDPTKIAIVGNGVEEPYFKTGSRGDVSLNASLGKPYLIVVGGLTERKGAAYTLNVAQSLAKMKSQLQILVVGKSEEKFADQAKEFPNIVHVGYKNLDELPELIRGSVALLFLSRYETFGIPAAEAMAAGTPVIVASFAALPEIVGEAGIVVDVRQPDNIARIAEELFENQQLRLHHILLGLKKAQLYKWERCVSQMLTAFSQAS